MDFFSVGSLLVWLSALGAACYLAQKGNFSAALFFLTGAALVIRLFAASDPWLHFWDERYHFLVAKNMLTDPFKPVLYKLALLDHDYRVWSQSHIWMHKPPITMWLIAGSFRIFGVSEFAGRLPSAILSSISVVLVYQVALYLLKDRWQALAASFFQSVNGLTIELAAGRNPTDHVDTVFYFFVLAGVWSAVRFAASGKAGFLGLTGIALGLAILSKWLVGLIIIPLFFILCVQKYSLKRAFGWSAVVAAIGFLIALPWQWYIYHRFPLEAAWESRFNMMHFTEVLEGQGHPWWFFPDRARTNWNELIYPAWFYFGYRLCKNYRNAGNWMIATWILAPYFIFSFSLTKMQGYVLFTAPAQFMILAMFLAYLHSRFSAPFGWLSKLVFAAVLLLALRYGFERARFFWPPESQASITRDIKAFSPGLDERTVIFNTPYFIEFMFYTPAIAYERMPDENDLRELAEAGYQVRYAVMAEGRLKLLQTPE